MSNLPLWEVGKVGSAVASPSSSPPTTSPVCISRTFTCKNFPSALSCLNLVGAICENLSHHADLHLVSYRDVVLVIYTHSVGGVTENDLELARAIDEEVKVNYSPKWLKEHPEASYTSAVPKPKE
ncbi:hypothetical protein TrRE_jg7527 [Triparma retinervis]|uniref:4a-hydroxytetrahydrobiopterin dehydratase n=1 Tax=Triparma retinervis TaxID=2557542 RepID=A0A9W7DTP0_9STRA|nr:hypothetical protein TrRE_jg7527 [Triparma retinervis]